MIGNCATYTGTQPQSTNNHTRSSTRKAPASRQNSAMKFQVDSKSDNIGLYWHYDIVGQQTFCKYIEQFGPTIFKHKMINYDS